MFKLFQRKSASPRENLRQILGEAELPTFPTSVVKAMQKFRDEKASLGDVADILATDPGITVRILRTVNSARFSLRNPVKNLHLAVSLLGRGEIESLLVTVGVASALPKKAVVGFDPERFWNTAARRASVAKALAARVDPSTASEAFSAGLLQDMALPLLAHRMGENYASTLESWHSGPANLESLERESFGWDHAEVGAWMGEDWGFPEVFVQAIATHHGGGESPLPTTQIVAGIREVGDEQAQVEGVVDAAEESMGLPRHEIAEIVSAAFGAAGDLAPAP